MTRSIIKFKTTITTSNRAMRLHLNAAEKYREYIQKAGLFYGFQSSIIAGIGSRESGWGLFLKPKGPKGTGDFSQRDQLRAGRKSKLPPDGLGFGRGLMQIDYDFHKFARTGNWRDPRENIFYGVKLLNRYKNIIMRKTDFTGLKLLKAAIASYNAGPGAVIKALSKNLEIDRITTGGDYSYDILNRAGYFQLHGWD